MIARIALTLVLLLWFVELYDEISDLLTWFAGLGGECETSTCEDYR